MPKSDKISSDGLGQFLAEQAKEFAEKELTRNFSGSLYPWTKERADEFASLDTETLLYDEYFLNGAQKRDGRPWLRPKIAETVIEIVHEWIYNGLDLALIVAGHGVGKTALASLLQWILHFKYSCLYDFDSVMTVKKDHSFQEGEILRGDRSGATAKIETIRSSGFALREVSGTFLSGEHAEGRSTGSVALIDEFIPSQGVDPLSYFGLRPDSTVAFLSLSKTVKKAKKITFGAVKNSFNSQFNKDYFPYDKNVGTELRIDRNSTLIFPNTATEAAIAGYDVYSAIIDEASFMEEVEDSARSALGENYDQAESAFQSAYGRMDSRFDDPKKLNGMIIMISSLNHSEDYMMRMIRRARGDESEELNIYYKILAPWESKPKLTEEREEEYFYFDTDKYEVIDAEEEVQFLDDNWIELPHEELVLRPHNQDPNVESLYNYRKSVRKKERDTKEKNNDGDE